jgi:hypothetical protein
MFTTHDLHLLSERSHTAPVSNPKVLAITKNGNTSPITVARKLSEDVPVENLPPLYIKTSISHLLPVNYPSPLTQPEEVTEAIEARYHAVKKNLTHVYKQIPITAQQQFSKKDFKKYMYPAIKHDARLSEIFENSTPPRISNSENLASEAHRQYPFRHYTGLNIKIEGHTNGQFIFEKRTNYTLIGWCHQNKHFSFQEQSLAPPSRKYRAATVSSNNHPIEAKLSNASKSIHFSQEHPLETRPMARPQKSVTTFNLSAYLRNT